MSTLESTRAAPGTSIQAWLAVAAVALATFTVVTAEMLPVGLLPELVSGLGVSTGVAGLTVTVPGLVAAVASIVLPVVAGKLDRKIMFGILLTLMVVANLISALAPNFALLLTARVLVGVCIGGVWSMVVGLAGRLVAERHVGIAAATIFSGIAIASVVGVPAGTFLGQHAGWRAAFATMTALSALVLVALLIFLPRLAARNALRFRDLPGLLRRVRLRNGLIVTLFLVTGHFAAYTYVAPFLTEVSGVQAGSVSGLLLIYGVAGIAGNFVAGMTAVRRVRETMIVITLLLTATMLLLPTMEGLVVASVGLLVIWGLSYGGVSVSLQTWVVQAIKDVPDAGGPLMSTTFNLGIALGAFVGGRVVDAFAPSAVMWVAGGLVITALAAVWATPWKR